MKLSNSVNGNVPLEGDRTFRWQAIPANAKILSATAKVTPVDAARDGSFAQVLGFRPATSFGTTKSLGKVTLAGPPVTDLAWVEVDFHARRTLAGVTGSFNGATLQVDVGGGTYVEINRTGAFKTPSDPTDFSLTGSSVSLPALTVAKLKLTQVNTAPDLTNVVIRSVPSNVSLRVGDLAPFWNHVGEMTSAESTPDFGAVLQAALTTAKTVNGFYDLPITLHSDTIARFKVELEIEILVLQDVSTKAVPDVALPFDVSTLSKTKAAEFDIEIPANSRVVPGETTAHVRGAFDETRIAAGPIGDDRPTAAVEISPTYSQAQIIALKNEVAAFAIDLLLESLTPSARLQLDIRGDFDGKPDEIPLLPAPVEFRIEQQAEKGASWTSVPLPSEFLFAKAGEKGSRYWLLLQSLEGRAVWTIEEVSKSQRPADDYLPVEDKETRGILNAQRTLNGGLSWQDASPHGGTLLDSKATPPFVALLRLRNKPKNFKMPIRLQIGTGEKVVQKKLDRFEPLGRVDFTIDAELADGINKYLETASAATVPETQHLVNADFERWERLGEEMTSRLPPIQCKVPINAVAFAPDGALAYVLDQVAPKDGFLLLVDVACNKKIDDKRIALDLKNPLAFTIHPDGTRAYVTDGRNLRAVSLESHEALGLPVRAIDQTEPAARTLTLSPDGRRLYLVNVNTTTRKNVIRIIETDALEQPTTVDKTVPPLPEIENFSAAEEPSVSPTAIAISPDERWLYVLVDIGTTGGALVKFIDTTSFTALAPSVSVGPKAKALALTPDGKKLVVTNMDGDNVSIIDTTTRAADLVPVSTPPTGVPNQLPTAVALSPDGNYAYVFNQGSRTIDTIDINDRKVVKPPFTLGDGIPNDENVAAMALSLQGDQIYVVNTSSDTLSSIQLGARVPSEWQRTSGDVQPLCLPDFHQVAVIGAPLLPTSLSQVVPVAELCGYEFSFWGIAVEPKTDEPPAIAEVLWLNSACGLLQTDSITIEVIDVEGDLQSLEFFKGLATGTTQKAPLVFHRLTTRKVSGETQPLTSPAGAEQAEVRFSVGKGAAAAIDLVSLSATSELAANGDFKLQKNGELVGWTLVPETTPGFMVSDAKEGLQLSNAGAATAELVQTVPAKSERPFTIEFQGKSTSGPSLEPPRVELRWLKADGSAGGDPTLLEILPDGLDSAIASGTSPKDSSKVEIHVVAPAKTVLEVKRVSLVFPETTKVPVKFISEAPGDMTVSEVRIAFEKTAPKAPPIPDRGLCTATPPGREPGEKGGSCYCHHCEEETEMTEMIAVTTAEGRPATMARCSTCRTRVLSVGGPVVANARSLPPSQAMVPQPVLVRSSVFTRRPSGQFPIAAEALRLTDIPGIGEARAKQLAQIGIDSVEKLAASSPATVGKIKFITPRMAEQIIARANFLLGS